MVGSGVAVIVAVGGGVKGAGVAVETGVGLEGGEKVAAGSGTGVEVGIRVMTCPHPDRKNSPATAPTANTVTFLAVAER